jgi:hypothetical protein
VKVTQQGVDGRLQAILRAHEQQMGDFTCILTARPTTLCPTAAAGSGATGARAISRRCRRWDVKGAGEWRDNAIVLNSLSTGFDKLQYGTMLVSTPRLTLEQPIRWLRDEQHPKLTGALSLDAGKTTFSGGSELPPSTLSSRSTAGIRPGSSSAAACAKLAPCGDRALGWRTSARPGVVAKTVADRVPAAGAAGLEDEPARRQLYAQVAFSAAAEQGFEAGGHGVLKGGSAWMPDNQINGVDFVLPFRFSDGTWQLGTRRPVSLRIGEVVNQVTARNLTADLQGTWPWSEDRRCS